MKKLSLLFALFFVVGCTTSMKNMRTKSTVYLCTTEYIAPTSKNNVIELLAERGKIRRRYKNAIKNGKIGRGMNKCEVRKAWGNPKDINKTIASYGTSEQWVYDAGQYVYFEGGVVTTIQG